MLTVSPTFVPLQFHFKEKPLLTTLNILEDITTMLNNIALLIDSPILGSTY